MARTRRPTSRFIESNAARVNRPSDGFTETVSAGQGKGLIDGSTRERPDQGMLTLETAIRLALENHPLLRAAGGRIDAATGRADQAGLWSNPELELSTEDWPAGGRFRESKNLVGVTQTLPYPGKKPLDRQIGASAIRGSEADLEQHRLERVRAVKTAFFQVLAAGRFVEIESNLVQVAESSAATARRRVEAGAAPAQEQLRAEIQLEQARTELAGFQREVSVARQTLAEVLGRPDLNGLLVTGALIERASLTLLDHAPEQWLAAHPSMIAGRTARERAELELRRVRLEPYPDVKVGVAGGRSGLGDEAVLQFSFSLPLPLVDRAKGKKQEARANVAVAEAELAAIEQRLRREWHTASQRFRTAAEQVVRYRERILPKADQALRLVRMGFEEGKFGFIDLLDTQRTAAESRLAYQQRLLELTLAQADLEALLQPQVSQASPIQ